MQKTMQNVAGETLVLDRNAASCSELGENLYQATIRAHIQISTDKTTATIFYRDGSASEKMHVDAHSGDTVAIKLFYFSMGHDDHEYCITLAEQPFGWMPLHWLV